MIFRINGQPIQSRLLITKGYWYTATPYSRFAEGINAANREACRIAGILIADGINVFSPIAHSHAIAMHSGLDPLDLQMWIEGDKPMMGAAEGLIVVEMDGWRESVGVQHEIKVFQEAAKPIVHLSLEDSGNVHFTDYGTAA